jgi:uncharacterized membrane protein
MEDKLISSPAKSQADVRVISIDVLKGVSIFLVILAHTAELNFVPSQLWVWGLLYTLLDVFGPSMFIFLSCLGVVFSVKKRQGTGDEKKARNAVFLRAAIIFLMSCVVNLVLGWQWMGPLSFWTWFILQFIAFGQIITYYALKMPKMTRMILAFLVIFIITPFLFDPSKGSGVIYVGMENAGIDYTQLNPGDLSNPYALLYFLLFFQPFESPLFPWIAVPLIASIVGEALVKSVQGGSKTKRPFQKAALTDGVIFVVIAVIFGSYIDNNDLGFGIIAVINDQPYFHIPGVFEFLIMHSSLNLLYGIGMALIILSITYYVLEIKQVRRGRITNFLNFYGRFSLSLFLFSAVFAALPDFISLAITGKMTPVMTLWPIPTIAFYIIAVWAFLYYFLKLLVTRYKGIGTVEWVTSTFGRGARGAQIFFETQIRYWKEQFEKISLKAKQLLKLSPSEEPLSNPLEIYMADALGENVVEEPPDTIKERARMEKKREKEDSASEDDDTFGVF